MPKKDYFDVTPCPEITNDDAHILVALGNSGWRCVQSCGERGSVGYYQNWQDSENCHYNNNCGQFWKCKKLNV